MINFDSALFSPLGKEFCKYFYWLTVFAFIFLVLAVVHVTSSMMKGKMSMLQGVFSLLAPGLMYFNNRLLYSMCVH